MFGHFLLKKIENFNFFFEKFQKSLKINEKSMKTFSGIKSDGRNGKSDLELTKDNGITHFGEEKFSTPTTAITEASTGRYNEQSSI